MIAASIALIIWVIGLSYKDHMNKKNLRIEPRVDVDEKLGI